MQVFHGQRAHDPKNQAYKTGMILKRRLDFLVITYRNNQSS